MIPSDSPDLQDQFYTIQNLQRSPVPQTSNWPGTFFAVSYSKPALTSEHPQNKNRHSSPNPNLSPVFYFHGLTLKKCLTVKDLKARYLHEPNGTFTQVVSPLCKTIVHYGKVNMNYLHK